MGRERRSRCDSKVPKLDRSFTNSAYRFATRLCYTDQRLNPVYIGRDADGKWTLFQSYRLNFSYITSSYTFMKKPQKPFTFEVKRSRLPSRKASSFQRYVVPHALGASLKLDAPEPPVAKVADTPSLRSVARILPSLSSERIWTEEHASPATAAPALIKVETVEEPEIEVSAAGTETTEPAVDLPKRRREQFKRFKPRAKSHEGLARGERWKRRLPRSAW